MKYLNLLIVIFFINNITQSFAEKSDTSSELNARNSFFWSATFENDIFNQTDQGYTNGGRIAVLWPEGHVAPWLLEITEQVPFFLNGATRRFGISVGQSMFTPDDIRIAELVKEDRPYAGWLYATASITADSKDRLDELQLSLGVVGESALAAQTQEYVHEVYGGYDPKGWDNQLNDELAVMISYQRTWKSQVEFDTLYGLGIDFSPNAGFSLGNVFTKASVGGLARIGFDLPQDYGPPRISPSTSGSDFFIPQDNFGWYLFAGFEVRAVAWNIFLDGNTVKDSHSVDKKPLVADGMLGIATQIGRARLAYTHVYRSKEYDGQDSSSTYGGITVNWQF